MPIDANNSSTGSTPNPSKALLKHEVGSAHNTSMAPHAGVLAPKLGSQGSIGSHGTAAGLASMASVLERSQSWEGSVGGSRRGYVAPERVTGWVNVIMILFSELVSRCVSASPPLLAFL